MSFVVKVASKQYIISTGSVVAVDNLKGKQPGDVLDLPVLLAFGDDKNNKLKSVKATYLSQQKGKKIRVVKFKSKSNYHRRYGFRSVYSLLQIEGQKKVELSEKNKKAKSKIKPNSKKTTPNIKSADKELTTKSNLKNLDKPKKVSKTPKKKEEK